MITHGESDDLAIGKAILFQCRYDRSPLARMSAFMEQFPYKSCRRRQFDNWDRVDDRDDVKAFIRRMREKAQRERESSSSVTSAMAVSGPGKPKKRLSDKMTLTEKGITHILMYKGWPIRDD